MTLNLTLTTPGYVIQTSDRRAVSIPDGLAIDDDANKSVVVHTSDGMFAVTFAGIGSFRESKGDIKRIDLWLADRIAEEGVPELPITRGAKIIGRVATDLFKKFRDGAAKRHTFTLAGWNASGSKPRAELWTVSNCAASDGRMLERARQVIDVRQHWVRDSGVSFYAFGLHAAIARGERRRLQAALRKLRRSDRVAEALVSVIRAAAAKPQWSWGINGNVLAVVLARDGRAISTFYPDGKAATNRTPIVVWHERGFNICTGDAEIAPSANFGYEFGPGVVVVDAMGSGQPDEDIIPDVLRVASRFRVTQAKFKREEVEPGSVYEMVRIIPRTQRARRMMERMKPLRSGESDNRAPRDSQ